MFIFLVNKFLRIELRIHVLKHIQIIGPLFSKPVSNVASAVVVIHKLLRIQVIRLKQIVFEFTDRSIRSKLVSQVKKIVAEANNANNPNPISDIPMDSDGNDENEASNEDSIVHYEKTQIL